MTALNVRQILVASLAALCAAAVVPIAQGAEPQLAHAVYFTLKDHSPKSREAFIASCEKYLTAHKGAVSFTIGTMAEDVKEPVSDREFDVALHVVFEDKAALAAYLKSERHDKFVAENKDHFAKVRVFDSYVPVSKTSAK
jgi:quinol monooxygenase YgiN